MKPPSSPEPYLQQSVSSGGAPPSAKAIYQQRKNYGRNVSEKGDVSEYKVEHLATFAMQKKEAALIVDESIHKLKLLDARGKVWSQEIFLNIGGKFIKLLDCDSREELENFFLGSLFHIQSVVNACNYNNICALLIKSDETQSVDVHLFQCLAVPADVIRADINSALRGLKSKKGEKSKPDTGRVEAAIQTSSLHSSSATSIKNGAAQATKAAAVQNMQQSSSNQQDKTQKMLAFKINRDVEILNHALDDIELFVLMVQKSAIVAKEPPQQQSKRKSSKHPKDKGTQNGDIEMKGKLPPKEKFVECLQKFRLCFNLLAKLKSQIKDPSSVELLHFIFQPLGMIIRTCCGPDLARQVRLPPFSQPTIEFIRSSANPQEIKLWKSLGDFWTKFREEFPTGVAFPPYEPTFSSGWVPPTLPPAETEDEDTDVLPVIASGFILKARGHEIESIPEPPSPPPVVDPTPTRQQSISNGSGSSGTLSLQQEFYLAEAPVLVRPPTPPPKLCRAMYDFTARNDRELTVQANDILDVLDHSKAWWKVKNKYGETGFAPMNIMVLLSSLSDISTTSSTESPLDVFPPLPILPEVKPQPKFSRAPSPPPMIHLPTRNPSPPPPPPMIHLPTRNPSPPPPPMIPLPTRNPSPPPIKAVPLSTALSSVKLRSSAFSNAKETTDNVKKSSNGISENLQEELRNRVDSQKKRNFVLPRKSSSSSDIVINKSSSRAQVKHWLQSHGFSRITVDSLAALNGAQIFSLKKEELKEISEDEGSRVYSKLLIQRSLDGFHTTTGNSELAKIMLKRRQEVEVGEDS